MKKGTISSIVIFVLCGVATWTYFYFSRVDQANVVAVAPSVATSSVVTTTTFSNNPGSHSSCLEEDEVVEYDRISQNPLITQPKDASPVIYVRNKITKEIITSFLLENLRISGYPMEVHKCGVYAVLGFNSDPSKPGTLQIGERAELWKHDYRGEKKC